VLVGISRAWARSRSSNRSSDRSRIDSRPAALTGLTAPGHGGFEGFVGTNAASTNRLRSADSVMPWVRARAVKRAFVSRVTQVIRCVLSLIVERC
jgi:hypothetical protein